MTHNSYSHPFSRNDQSMVARWFWTVDRGLLGAALTLILVGVGSLLVGIVFTLFGAGTLAMGREKK